MSSNEVVRLGITLICDHLTKFNELTKKNLELKQKKMEGRHGRPTRILCINCNIWIYKMRRYRALELDTRVTTLLCSWVHPRIITEEDYVCEACKYLAMQQVASSCDNYQAGSSHKGHNHVCILCGFSILRRQSDKILRDNPSQLLRSMINILERRIAPRQITISDRICHPCWLRTQREARRYGNFTDDTRTLPSSADQAPQDSQEDDNPGSNTSEPSLNGRMDLQRINQESEQSSSSSTHSAPTNENKVFCPKCNTDLSLMSEGIQQMSVEDVLCQECYTVLEIASLNLSTGSIVKRAYGHQQVCFVCGSSILRAKTHKVTIDSPEGNVIVACIPTQQDQTKIIVARVYHYFEQEYEQLKKTCKGLDLTPLSKFRQRTAQATGVSETTVREILQEEERRNADKPREHVRNRGRPRKRPTQVERIEIEPEAETVVVKLEPDEYNTSNDDTDDTIDDDGQASRGQEIEIEPEAETVVVKLEPEEYNTVHAEIDPIAINVKVEPPDDEINEEEKRKELKRKQTNARQRAYYQRQRNLKKIIKKVPKSNAERQRKFRQRNAEKSNMDISNDDTDDTIDDDGQASREQEIEIEPEAETVVVKLEPNEYNTVHAEIDPIAINVKVEPPDDQMNDTNEILASQPATKRKRLNILSETGVTCTQQRRQDESASTPRSHRLKDELDESSQLGEEDIKIEIEIGEEGFS